MPRPPRLPSIATAACCSGIMKADHTIDNDASIARLAEIAVSFAKAGAHVRDCGGCQ